MSESHWDHETPICSVWPVGVNMTRHWHEFLSWFLEDDSVIEEDVSDDVDVPSLPDISIVPVELRLCESIVCVLLVQTHLVDVLKNPSWNRRSIFHEPLLNERNGFPGTELHKTSARRFVL